MNISQVETDDAAADEMIDFFRFNAFFGNELLKYQPISEQSDSTLNPMRYRLLKPPPELRMVKVIPRERLVYGSYYTHYGL